MMLSIEATMKLLFSIVSIASMHSSVAAMDSKPNLRRHLVQQDPCEVLIRVINYGADKPHKQEITCQMSQNDGGRILELDNISRQWMKTNNNNLKNGKMELFAPGAKIQGNKLRVPAGINPELRQKKIKNNQGNNGNGNGNNKVSSRNLATTIDNDKQILVVRVNDAGQSAESLSDSIFGTDDDTVNLKSQMAACSKDQLIINPASGNNIISDGVMQVNIASVQGRDKYTVESEAVNAMEAGLGCANAPCDFDHIMVCLPPGTSGSWIAYAYMNSYLSVYNNEWCTFVSTQMHEIGHNLNLGHSGEGTQEYGDTSGMMGYSYSSDDGPEMCFNGVKSWDLGWYSGGHVSLGYSQSWEGTLTSIADYDLSNPRTTIVQVTQSNGVKYYIMYNRNTGINSGTQEGANQVLITKKTGTKSSLVAKLGQDQTYFPFQGFMVKTGTIASGEASVLINKCYSNADCHDGDVCTIDSCVNNQCSHVLASECTFLEATVRVTTDNYPSETSWTLVNECTGITELSGDGMTQLSTEYTESKNVPLGRYKFTIYDEAADGICCSYGYGSYSVTLGSQTVGEGGEFGSSAVHTYGDCSTNPPVVTPAPVTPIPTPAPITPNPTLAPTTPNPTPAPITSNPTLAPTTPNPTPAPITPNPTLAPTTPAPVAVTLAPIPTTPAPVPTTPAPVPTTPAPVPTTPAPVPTTPAPVPTTSAPVPTTLAPVNTPPSLGPLTDITFDTFENGSSYIFEKNGGDAKVDDKKSKNGKFSAKLKKGGYMEHRTSHAVSEYTQLEVSFSFFHKFDKTDDTLSVEAITDSGNIVLATYQKNQYDKDTWYTESIEFQRNEFSSMKLKFMATTNRKEVFIDDVDFNAR